GLPANDLVALPTGAADGGATPRGPISRPVGGTVVAGTAEEQRHEERGPDEQDGSRGTAGVGRTILQSPATFAIAQHGTRGPARGEARRGAPGRAPRGAGVDRGFHLSKARGAGTCRGDGTGGPRGQSKLHASTGGLPTDPRAARGARGLPHGTTC